MGAVMIAIASASASSTDPWAGSFSHSIRTRESRKVRNVVPRRRSNSLSGKDGNARRNWATRKVAKDARTLAGQRRVALLELAALLGGQPGDLPAPAPMAPLPIGDGTALLRRPDLREAERPLAADTARIGVATADLYPRISLGGSGNSLRNDNVKGSDSFSFALGPLLSWSVPNIAVARSRVKQAEAQGDATLATFDGKVIGALKEVEQALARYDAEQQRNAALAEARDRTQTTYDLAQARYRAGSIALLDTFVAQ